jgi:lipoprotein-anchoring transpeptidase ErfK/SrfK
VVVAGDSLRKIAQKFGTTVELLQMSHRHAGANIRPGERFRVMTGKFSIVVDKSDNYLDLFLNDRFFKRYRVGTGQYNWTPTGTNQIVDRITQPAWYRPDGKVIPYGDPENLLGTHWLKLDIPGFGIHGTWEPDTIGKQSSAGCVRMLNDDVKELFTLVPVGTPVVIQD